MTDINKVLVIGRLVREPECLEYTASGTARLSISIAVNRSEKRGGEWADKASFFDITIWGKTAENVRPYLCKGKQVAVDGYIDQQRWEKDGQKHSRVVIVANSVQLLGGKNDDRTQDAPQQAGGHSDAGSGDGFPEDIPF